MSIGVVPFPEHGQTLEEIGKRLRAGHGLCQVADALPGMTSLSGKNRALFLTSYASFEAWEKDNQADEQFRAPMGKTA